MDLSEEITKLADSYDEDAEAEKQSVRAFAQGMLAGGAARQSMLKVAEVETPRDENGDYLPYFVIVTQSGIRLKVTVEVD